MTPHAHAPSLSAAIAEIRALLHHEPAVTLEKNGAPAQPAPPPNVTVRQVFEVLSDRGHGALLVILSLPFWFFVSPPGFSTAFGVPLVVCGLLLSIGRPPWLPRWLLDRHLPRVAFSSLLPAASAIALRTEKLLRPRHRWLALQSGPRVAHGLMVILMAALMAIPLFPNWMFAWAIALLGLGLLEEDGLFLLLGHLLGLLCTAGFIALCLLGTEGVHRLLPFLPL